jgi:1-aminocyclopropane-1-carboxylate deaminase/D-cysteine desulfhydrase-like pyridoxal-dependent ACC family enzyme
VIATTGSEPASPVTSTLTGVPVNAGAESEDVDVAGVDVSSDDEEHAVSIRAIEITKTEVRVNMSQSYNQEVTASCMESISF